jgi:hypothetical protein
MTFYRSEGQEQGRRAETQELEHRAAVEVPVLNQKPTGTRKKRQYREKEFSATTC